MNKSNSGSGFPVLFDFLPLASIVAILINLRNRALFDISSSGKNLYCVKHRKSKLVLYFPFKAITRTINTQLSFIREPGGFFEHYRMKYLYDGFTIPLDWNVIDCGAYIGGFSLSTNRKHAGSIYCLEPSPYNFKALELNVGLHRENRNIKCLNIALGETTEKSALHISGTGQDDSILGIDNAEDDFHETVDVQVYSFSDLASKLELNLDKTILKLEAEGSELAVINGLGNKLPAVITIDVSAEMFGKSPLVEVASLLDGMGYSISNPTFGINDEPIALICHRQKS